MTPWTDKRLLVEWHWNVWIVGIIVERWSLSVLAGPLLINWRYRNV